MENKIEKKKVFSFKNSLIRLMTVFITTIDVVPYLFIFKMRYFTFFSALKFSANYISYHMQEKMTESK